MHPIETRRVARLRCPTPWIALLGALFGLAAAPSALAWEPAGSDPERRAEKVYWQNRYRSLLEDAARLRAEVERERELYADANRRNYRRGRKRHVHREAMQAAAERLAEVEAQLATIEDEARRAGALPGWLYEVEAELEDADGRAGVATGPGDEGRNPLYLEQEQDEAR